MTEDVMRELKVIKDRINEVERKLDNYFGNLHEDNAANIDYIAMMEDIDLPSEEMEVE